MHSPDRHDLAPERRNPLADLITEVMAANGWSVRQVVAQSRSAGFEDLTKSHLDRLRYEPPRRLVPSTMYALAAGLGLPPQVVFTAALASMGIDHVPVAARTPEDAVRQDRLLSARDKETILTVLATLRQHPRR